MFSRYEEIMKTKPFLPFHIPYLPEEIIEKAREELNETEETRDAGLAELKKLIMSEKKLQGCMDDSFLLQFLRARKFDVKKAFTLYTNFYKVKKAYPECYDHCDVDQLVRLLRTRSTTLLPYRDADGCVVLILELKKWNPDDYNIAIIFRGMTVLALFAVEDVATQVCGMKIIIDTAGTTLRHMRSFTPKYLRLFARALQNCVPVRFKFVHFYNNNSIFSYLWSIVEIFLSRKMRQRVYFHGDNAKQMHKFIAKDILTENYGGDNLHFDNVEFWEAELTRYCEKFTALTQTGYRD